KFMSDIERGFTFGIVRTISAMGTSCIVNNSTTRPADILSSVFLIFTLPALFSLARSVFGMLITKVVRVFMSVLQKYCAERRQVPLGAQEGFSGRLNSFGVATTGGQYWLQRQRTDLSDLDPIAQAPGQIEPFKCLRDFSRFDIDLRVC